MTAVSCSEGVAASNIVTAVRGGGNLTKIAPAPPPPAADASNLDEANLFTPTLCTCTPVALTVPVVGESMRQGREVAGVMAVNACVERG